MSFECVSSHCQDPVSLQQPHLDIARQLFNNEKLLASYLLAKIN